MAYDSQRSYEQRQKDKGLVQVLVWVPEGDREALREYAAKLRRKHERALKSPPGD